MRFALEIDVAAHQHTRRRTVDLQAIGMHHAVIDLGLGSDGVKSETLAENIVEIEGQAAHHPLQAEQSEQLADPRVGLEELPLGHFDLHVATQCAVIKIDRRTRPGEITVEMRGTALDRTGITEPLEQFAGIRAVDLERDLRPVLAYARLPLAAAGKLADRIGQRDAVETPDAAFVARLQLKLAETTRPERKIIGRHVERRQFIGRFLRYLSGGFKAARLELQLAEPGGQLAAPGAFPGHVAIGLRRREARLDLPRRRRRRQVKIGNMSSEGREVIDTQGHRIRQ